MGWVSAISAELAAGALVEETTASAQSLNDQARTLADSIAFFRLS